LTDDHTLVPRCLLYVLRCVFHDGLLVD
jgi:hypothetical protein